ncbi:3-ketoacyl-CoA thiolase 2, peroxisomal [Turnera subulata]|uniref:acetyl-CoA C-acyltransferase n=1 Tax=Turnera subulata TaxID=218843 RepID=A0A9Q0FWG4_9ROSI|nr:3-ketoacyl-CoA thiolase 2, peroxisomal [Turnera subulata]
MEKAINRQRVLLDHLRPSSPFSSPPPPPPHSYESSSVSASACLAGDSASYQRGSVFDDDVVIVAAYRTPFSKAKRGMLKDTRADDLIVPVLKAVIEKTNGVVDPAEVGDIVVGTVLAKGDDRACNLRMSAFYAGFPETVPLRTVNRQCSSGLQAVADVAAAIKAGFYDIGIGAGVETMTTDPMATDINRNPKVQIFPKAADCLLPMGITSENVAERFGVTRKEQDQAAVDSHRKAAAATAAGKFKDEIIPVATKIVDPKTGEEKPIIVSVDDGIRPDTSLAFTAVGVDPAVMGVGPVAAIPAAVKSAGLELDNINLFEINEAFGSQFVYCQKKLGLDPEKINVNGGAMAIGHPLGATGARCVATLLHEMKRRGRDCRFGVISMCIGTGMGAAAVLERGDVVDDLRNVNTAM